MEKSTLNSTDLDLLKALQTSALSEEEKKEFEGLLATMQEEQKLTLQKLIDESNRAKQAFEAEKDKKLIELNMATAEKLKIVEKEEIKYVREEFEKFDQQETEKELTNLEGNLERARPKVMETQMNHETKKTAEVCVENPINGHHERRNFILILLGLVIVAGTLTFGLLTL